MLRFGPDLRNEMLVRAGVVSKSAAPAYNQLYSSILRKNNLDLVKYYIISWFKSCVN
jgi:hypothetical protein